MRTHNGAGALGVSLLLALLMTALTSAMSASRVIRAPAMGGQTTAMGLLRAIDSAQAIFAASCGGGGFAQSLDDLSRPPRGADAGFLPPALQRLGVPVHGYIVTLHPGAGAGTVWSSRQTCKGTCADTVSSYFAEAHPVQAARGRRSFAIDARGAIFVNDAGTPIQPDMVGATTLR